MGTFVGCQTSLSFPMSNKGRNALKNSLQSHIIHYTTVSTGCIVLLTTRILNLMCKISGVTLYSEGKIAVIVIHLSTALTPASFLLAWRHIVHTTSCRVPNIDIRHKPSGVDFSNINMISRVAGI